MRAPIFIAAWTFALAAALAPGAARAEPGPAPQYLVAGFGLQAGVLDQHGTLSDPADATAAGPAFTGRGGIGVFRLRLAGLGRRPHTRFGSLAGGELALGIGYFRESAIAHDQGVDGIRLGPVYLDADASLLVAPFYSKR